jgi:hypothetical protein
MTSIRLDGSKGRLAAAAGLCAVLACCAAACDEGGAGETCVPNSRTICKDGVTYWTDSCGARGDRAGDCACGCNADFTACRTCEGQCTPDCSQKCCGSDGCEGTCPDRCDEAGQTCNPSSCLCEAPIVPTPTTRLRIVNNCQEPIWIAHSDNVADPQNIKLAHGEHHDYNIPDAGLPATRFWPKLGCDSNGQGCTIGDSGEGGGKPCPAAGCHPPVDSKFEATFAPLSGTDATWYNLSQVDGYTLPFKVVPVGQGAGQGSCVTSDCSGLSLASCPTDEDLSGGGRHPAHASEDLRVTDSADNVIACMSPCKKWNYPAPYGLGKPEDEEPGLHMCCPTPIPDPVACAADPKCMTSEACRDKSDPLSVEHTKYVIAMRKMCPSAYSYAYDDAQGLHNCPAETKFVVTFCP